jgi:stringent starvation protein B
MNMTSNKPYLIRALYDWIIDNHLTPHILVNADYPGVQVPQEHVIQGRIVLNISPQACRGLHIENDRIVFTARFSGITVQIFLIPAAVFAIYAKENGRGMEFSEEYSDQSSTLVTPAASDKKINRVKPALTLVKKDE